MGIFKIDGGGARRSRFFADGSNPTRKLCSYCNSTPATLYCISDSVFLCICCDSKLHEDDDNNKLLHERVWICEVCEQAPAVFTCKADAAALCAACDGEIHSANSLASRHERVSVTPFYDTMGKMEMKSEVGDFRGESPFHAPTPMELMLLDSETPENFLDFEVDYYQMSSQPCIVPVQNSMEPPPPLLQPPPANSQFSQDLSTIDFTISHPSFNITVSPSSMDLSVVPSAFSVSKNQVLQLQSERKARVLRYKEKKMKRKFEKTIRYASRKANAEIKPRIKGRFAKMS